MRFTDERQYSVSEATVCRLLKAHDLITSPAHVVIKAADQFHTKTTRPKEMWQTDFTYFTIIGWGWMYPDGQWPRPTARKRGDFSDGLPGHAKGAQPLEQPRSGPHVNRRDFKLIATFGNVAAVGVRNGLLPSAS